MADSLQCTFTDAARNHLRDGIRLSTAAKVDFFEEMVALAAHFGARHRGNEREARQVAESRSRTAVKTRGDAEGTH